MNDSFSFGDWNDSQFEDLTVIRARCLSIRGINYWYQLDWTGTGCEWKDRSKYCGMLFFFLSFFFFFFFENSMRNNQVIKSVPILNVLKQEKKRITGEHLIEWTLNIEWIVQRLRWRRMGHCRWCTFQELTPVNILEAMLVLLWDNYIWCSLKPCAFINGTLLQHFM